MNLSKIALVLVVGCAIGATVGVLASGLPERATRAGSSPEEQPRQFEVRVDRGSRLGVAVRDVDEADLKREKLPSLAGVVVDEVRSGSPAAEAGLRTGDVIVEFDGERVRSASQLARLVRETPAGRRVPAVVVRGGERVRLDVRIQGRAASAWWDDGEWFEGLRRFGRTLRLDLPDVDIELPEIAIGDIGPDRLRSGARFGVTAQRLDPQLAEYFGVEEGVLVSSVTDGTPAARAGLKAGDVLVAVDGATVRDVGDLRRRLARIEPGRPFAVAIVRDRKPMTVQATLDERPARRPI